MNITKLPAFFQMCQLQASTIFVACGMTHETATITMTTESTKNKAKVVALAAAATITTALANSISSVVASKVSLHNCSPTNECIIRKTFETNAEIA